MAVDKVMTVSGPVRGEELGITLMHEHIICAHHEFSMRGFGAGFDDTEIMVEEIEYFQRAGGKSVVEVTPRGVGRDVRKLREIADATGVNIIANTSFYHEAAYPPEVFELTINQLAHLMIGELTEGIDGTDIKAGVIGELGTGSHYVCPAEERVFRAAARAQIHTGVAISTHTYWGGELAHDQIDILMDEGVPADRIIIGHLGDKRNPEYFAEIASRGVYIQFDHIGFTQLLPEKDRASIIIDMVERGFENQILISMDICWKSHLHHFGGKGFDYMLTDFVPRLRKAELSDEQVEQLLVSNTRRALSGSA